jgi:hypothetical protein
MLSLIPTIVVLGAAAFAAGLLVTNRSSAPDASSERAAAAKMLALAAAIQAVHFAEEFATGFPERLGALFGIPAMSTTFFVVFNVTWLVIWFVSVPGVRSAHAFAFFVAWFLAIAGMVNGIAHPLLSVAAGGYFPGLFTSPVICSAAYWLWKRLRAATAVY